VATLVEALEENASTGATISPEDVRVQAHSDVPGIVVIRNAWDEGWSATVDGQPAPVFLTDFFIQGVPVPAGTHDVRLVYTDPNIGRGLAGSAAAIVLWFLALVGTFVAGIIRRRRAAEATVSNPT
jgi:uncharacterized membrane protein YfhO